MSVHGAVIQGMACYTLCSMYQDDRSAILSQQCAQVLTYKERSNFLTFKSRYIFSLRGTRIAWESKMGGRGLQRSMFYSWTVRQDEIL